MTPMSGVLSSWIQVEGVVMYGKSYMDFDHLASMDFQDISTGWILLS